MKDFKTYLILVILTTVLSGQVLWNDPPDYIWYENGQRTIEVILPPPQNFVASTINGNQVILTWDEYWSNVFFIQYKSRMGYSPDPNRFSLYKQNLTDGGAFNAFDGVTWNENQYIDLDVVTGKEYMYQILASDLNYMTYGGLQRWSKRDDATAFVTVGQTSTPNTDLLPPNNFSGYYEPNSATINLSWDYVKDASSYTLYKSYKNPDNSNQWEYLTIPVGNVGSYNDSSLLPYVGYVYTLIAVNGNIKSDRTNPLPINSGTLSIKDEEYWEAVEEYEKDQKIGWFGCSRNK